MIALSIECVFRYVAEISVRLLIVEGQRKRAFCRGGGMSSCCHIFMDSCAVSVSAEIEAMMFSNEGISDRGGRVKKYGDGRHHAHFEAAGADCRAGIPVGEIPPCRAHTAIGDGRFRRLISIGRAVRSKPEGMVKLLSK
ncbi:hypothetical protein [Burkholderia thailandensis]|uniref:hypothetical protein n=1 Tax=Burkholderia thailandensis TaxID=57975 RepID=UPI00298F95FC|nr:hypothetical protein [Burkholderia thailandensis]